jgi:hypothetical protein
VKTAWCTSEEIFMVAVKENTAVSVLQSTLRFLYSKFDIMRLFTSSIVFIVTLHAYSYHLLALITLLNKTRRINATSAYKTKKILRWRTTATSIKLGRNNDQRAPILASVW